MPLFGKRGTASCSAVILGTLFFAPMPASAADDPACAQVAGVLEKLSDRMPKMTESARASRMGVVMLGSSASLAAAVAQDAGWSDEEIAPMTTMRDAREPDASGQTMDMAAANALFAEQGLALADVMTTRCPATGLPDLSALAAGGTR